LQISIRNLEKRYRNGKVALRDIDLDINPGIFGLLGPNGAGKTTLMRILVTLLKPTTGEVSVDGLDIRKDRGRIRKLVGYLPQEFSAFARFRTAEFLDYVALLAGVRGRRQRSARVEERLEQVGLFDARDRRVSKLSGGMKRRLGIAQALIGEPALLIVDEPTVGLDPEERLRFRNLLSDLSGKGITVILSTHIVNDISSSCADMALLHDGRIVFNGSPEELVAAATGQVWLVTAAEGELDRLRERFPVISTLPAEQGFEVRLVAKEVTGYRAQQVEPNLEDAYICFMQSFAERGNILAVDEGW
jgi:ABC-type multidrug transport system ATPase subunit